VGFGFDSIKKMKTALRLSALSLLVVIIASACWAANFVFGYGRVDEQWETSNGAFKVRVQNYRSVPYFKSSYFVFQSAAVGSASWREVAAYPYDGFELTIPMPNHQVCFVGSDTGYFSLDSLFAVTTDRGLNWTIWLPGGWRLDEVSRPYFQPWGIEEITVNSDGSGSARLWVDYDTRRQSKVYRKAATNDFGRNWNVE